MMTVNEKTTAPDTSVGADDGQSLRNSTKSSITENTSQNKPQNVNTTGQRQIMADAVLQLAERTCGEVEASL